MRDNMVELRITNERNTNYEGCFKCKYFELPDEACEVMRCVHAIHTLKDWYTEVEENEEKN